MVTALKEFTLLGSRYNSGSPLPEPVWSQCDQRLQKVLERNRFVTTQPFASRAGATPAPRKRGRPRKEA